MDYLCHVVPHEVGCRAMLGSFISRFHFLAFVRVCVALHTPFKLTAVKYQRKEVLSQPCSCPYCKFLILQCLTFL